MKKILLLLTLFLSFTATATEDIQLLEKSCADGNGNDCLHLGFLYEKGQGVEQNYIKAKEYYEKACALENADSCFNLGLLYGNGQGVKQNYVKAKEYEETIPLNENISSPLDMVREKLLPDLIEKYDAIVNFSKNNPNTVSSYILGTNASKFKNAQQDFVNALELYKSLSEVSVANKEVDTRQYEKIAQGIKDAEKENKKLEKKEDNTMFNNVNSLRGEYEKACALENADGCYNLGLLYKEGQGVGQSYIKAKEYSEKACALELAQGCNNLGVLYEKGQGTQQSYFKAKEYFEKACALENADGCYNFGLLYDNGQGVKQNKTKAKELYGKACDLKLQLGCDNYKILNKARF